MLSTLLSEKLYRSVDTAFGNLELTGCLGLGCSRVEEGSDRAEPRGRQPGARSFPPATGLLVRRSGPGHPCSGALTDDLSFELGKADQHVTVDGDLRGGCHGSILPNQGTLKWQGLVTRSTLEKPGLPEPKTAPLDLAGFLARLLPHKALGIGRIWRSVVLGTESYAESRCSSPMA